MSDTMHDGILDNIRSIDKNGTLLDILLEFERVLDEAGLYAYKNWSLVKLLKVQTVTLLDKCKTDVSIYQNA